MKKIHLSIPNPCHEDWGKMTRAEKGRFCNSCKKTVIDFTAMSDRELVAFFKKPTTNLCGRFNQEQLSHDMIIPPKKLPWTKYVFKFTWPAFVLFLKSCGWKDKTIGKMAVNTEDVRNVSGSNPHEIATVGVLMAEILPIDTTFDKIQVRDTSSKGDVEFIEEAETSDTIEKPLIVDSTCEVSIVANTETDTSVISQKEMDTVFVVSDQIITRRKIVGAVCVSTVVTAQQEANPGMKEKESLFTIYPNPISNSGLLKMSLQSEKGDYIVLLLNGSGQIVQNEKVSVESKNQVLSFKLNKVSAGNYFIQLTNTKSGRIFTEKLIIQ
jgi:hypothetical protein